MAAKIRRLTMEGLCCSKGYKLISGTDARLCWLRLILIGATLSGMLCSLPLLLNTREYPAVPLLPAWLILPPDCGPFLLGLTFTSLLVAIWFFRPAILFFLITALYLFGCDQNREQPWFYLYWVMFLLNFLPEPAALAACRLVLSLVYFWAGINKLNSAFFASMPAWFVQPAADWGFPHAIIVILRDSVALTPLLEIFIATGIWFRKTRWLAVTLAVTMHLTSLLFLGPAGHNVNHVIWPWNLAMVALIVVLFTTKEHPSLTENIHKLSRFWGGVLVVGLYGFLPIFSFFGLWDSYLSFALYSKNLANADVYLSQSFLKRLPPKLRTYVYPVKNYNPAYQLPYLFEFSIWAEAEVGTPPLPEPRGYLVMFGHLCSYATNNDECRMLVQTRQGNIVRYRFRLPDPHLTNAGSMKSTAFENGVRPIPHTVQNIGM